MDQLLAPLSVASMAVSRKPDFTVQYLASSAAVRAVPSWSSKGIIEAQ